MKFSELKSVAHNIAHSLSSGMGLMIGVYSTDVYAEAKASTEGLTIDFLSLKAARGSPSPPLMKAVSLYRKALEDFCRKHGVGIEVFKSLTVRYAEHPVWGRYFEVHVESHNGKTSTDFYSGTCGERIKRNLIYPLQQGSVSFD